MKYLIISLLFLFSVNADDLIKKFKKENLKTLVEGHTFTEGPACLTNGDILFTSPRKNEIIRWSVKDQKASTYFKGEYGVSALYFQDSKIFATKGSKKRIIRIDSPKNFVEVAGKYNEKPFNKPNDLWVSPKGFIYFTDPNYGRGPLSQDGEFAYVVSPEGKVSRIDAKFNRPNGIVGSKDGKVLYITDAGDSKTYKFTIDENGKLGPQTLFTNVGGDGMTLDKNGNLYVTVPRQKAIVIVNPEGKEITRISDFGCTNCTFGKEGKILYITKAPGLWSIKLFD